MWQLLQGDVREVLKQEPDKKYQTCVTSPPYWGLRDYGLPPSVWGGEKDCLHEWETERTARPNSSGGKASENNPYAQKLAIKGKENYSEYADYYDRATYSSFCVKCGAWLGCLGLEPTPELFVEHMVEVFREVRRVLRDDGTLWLNLGDSYASSPTSGGEQSSKMTGGEHKRTPRSGNYRRPDGLKPKDLVGIPWRVAFALQADGWYLRSDIIWAKPNPMPESVTDRPTKAHEYIFLMSKSQKYYYDAEAIREPNVNPERTNYKPGKRAYAEGNTEQCNDDRTRRNDGFEAYANGKICIGRNKRTVWTVATQPFSEWGETYHLSPVAWDEISGDTMRITSPSCPIHAGCLHSVPKQFYDEHGVDALNRILHKHGNPVQVRLDGCAPIDPNREREKLQQNSGYSLRQYSSSAKSRNTEKSKTARAPETIPSCMPVGENVCRTHDTQEEPLLTEQYRGKNGNKISEGGCGDNPSTQILSDTVDKLKGQASPVASEHLQNSCICQLYHITTEKASHFATFPPKLIEPCILAGCPQGETVLDPFAGAGTTLLVSENLGRDSTGIELSAEYCRLIEKRMKDRQTTLFEFGGIT